MKVKCIDNKDIVYGLLSINNIYEVKNEDEHYFEVQDDLGRIICFYKERFEIIKEENKMRFKVGDKVRVREDLIKGKEYGLRFIDKMETMKGKIVTIEKVYSDDECYRIEEAGHFWTDEMLEEVKENKTEKTFREVIADIKEGEVWESQNKLIRCENGDITIIGNVTGENEDKMIFNKVNKYKLKRKQYTFEEAFKAYEEGKEIESCFSNRKFKTYRREELFQVIEIENKWYIND